MALRGQHAIEHLCGLGRACILCIMDMLGRVEHLAGFQFERWTVIWLEEKRTLQHVDSLISGVVVPSCDGAGRQVSNENDHLFSFHSGHALTEDLRPPRKRTMLALAFSSAMMVAV